MGADPIRTNDELWETVATVREGLREAGATAEAQRLHDAISVGGHPGEVWPETPDVLRELLSQRPRSLDEEAAAAAVASSTPGRSSGCCCDAQARARRRPGRWLLTGRNQQSRTLPIVAGYETIPGLENVYLEDSWVLGLFASDASLSFDLEAVLTEQHPQWHPPTPGEQYVHRRVSLTFPTARSIEWLDHGRTPATDAAGELDWGNIDRFTVENDVYELEGDWGHVRVVSDPPQIHDR